MEQVLDIPYQIHESKDVDGIEDDRMVEVEDVDSMVDNGSLRNVVDIRYREDIMAMD